MAELKTQKTDASVDDFIASVEDDQKREDSQTLVGLMAKITGEKPAMWGPSIVGFGTHDFKYESGREGTWMKIGFSPRKQNLTLYIMGGAEQDKMLSKLGKHSTGKSCLYIKRLSDVDMDVLSKMIETAANAR